MQSYKISFKGQKIFIGIDVHLNSWHVTCLTETSCEKSFTTKPSAQTLFDTLKRHYPDGEYHAVYEAGFSGFSTYYSLNEVGIDCIIINAADVPTSQYETVMKTDRIDSKKLAKALKNDLLRGNYIREKDSLDDLALVRIRKTIQRNMSAYKSRVKHMLYQNGVRIPEQFDKPSIYWSRHFIMWLKTDVKLLSSTRRSLDVLLLQVETIRKNLLEVTKEIRRLAETERYKGNVELLTSIPGIGTNIAMCLLTEIGNVARFHNEKQFASFIGLIPTSHSSGDKIVHGEKTFRGNKLLGIMLVEASWIAIHRDTRLGSDYLRFKERKQPQKAIVCVARKLSNIVFSVLKNQRKYVSI